MRAKQAEILEPKDPFRKKLPPNYQSELETSYRQMLGLAMSRQSSVVSASPSRSSDSHSGLNKNLTNAEHHAMTKNHVLLA